MLKQYKFVSSIKANSTEGAWNVFTNSSISYFPTKHYIIIANHNMIFDVYEILD